MIMQIKVSSMADETFCVITGVNIAGCYKITPNDKN